MPNNIDIAELKRLHAAAKLGGPMISVHIVSRGYEHCANLCTRLDGHKSDYPVAMMQSEWSDWLAAIHNAFPFLVSALESAERERDELRQGIESANFAARMYYEKIERYQAELSASDARILEAQLAEARKEAANLIRQTTPMPISLDPYERGKFDGRMYAVEQLEG